MRVATPNDIKLSDGWSVARPLQVVAPIYWVSRGSWFTVLGLFVIALDIAAAVAVGGRAYRFLHNRWRIPDWFVGVPLLFIAPLPIPLINIAAFYVVARVLPRSLLAS